MPNQIQKQKQSAIIGHPIFIGSLILLLVNDFILKPTYPNWITGKLSDIAGLIMLPMLLSAVVPRLRLWAIIIPGLIFLWWKLPLSQPIVKFSNIVLHIPVNRVLDYSDLFVLAVLPLTWLFILKLEKAPSKNIMPMFVRLPIIIVGGVACVATSMPLTQRYQQTGEFYVDKTFKLRMTQAKALEKIKAEGYQVSRDTTQYMTHPDNNYRITNLILSNKDTLEYANFYFSGKDPDNKITVTKIKTKDPVDIRTVRSLRQYYRKLIDEGLVEDIKE